MTMRRPQMVLIAFAVAAWLGAMLELGASASDAGDCLPVTSCGETYVDGARLLTPQGCEAVGDQSPHSATACYAAASY